jgi:hypothetical protein
MKSSIPLLLLLFAFSVLLEAQQATQEVVKKEVDEDTGTVTRIRLQEFETILLGSIRQQFRSTGIFATVQSCRLPDYGPVVTVTIQPPPYYYTRPVLQELERRQKIAEQQAQRIRAQFDRTSQIVKLKAKEADLLEQIRVEKAKKKAKSNVAELESDLKQVRETLKKLETTATVETVSLPSADSVTEVDLNKMITENYLELVQKLTTTVKNVLAENAALLVQDGEIKISIATTIRDNFLGNQEKNILFVLDHEDVDAFRSGTLDAKALREKVLVTYRKEE